MEEREAIREVLRMIAERRRGIGKPKRIWLDD